MKGAAEEWEVNRRKRDPNFAAKIPALQREIAYLLQTEGHPGTPQGVKEQMDRAYKAIAVTAAPIPPKPTPKPAITPITGGTVGGNAQPPANSTLDIIKREMAKRGGASAR